MAESAKDTTNGQKFWGSKNERYLQKKSRGQIEDNLNFTVLYLQLDIENSKVNFYGEVIAKKFVVPQGIPVKGVIEVRSGDQSYTPVVGKDTELMFSCYVDHLRELNINPQIGDYFVSKNKWYFIYEKTALDDNQVAVATDKAVSIRFSCAQVIDEEMFIDPWSDSSVKPGGDTYLNSY